MIRIKRASEPPEANDGARLLVDRLWPRGVRKKDAGLTAWAKDAGPSDALRTWFGHDPERWDEFRTRYREELDVHPAAWRPILELAKAGPVTLVYAAKDSRRNNAAVLKEYLEERLPAA